MADPDEPGGGQHQVVITRSLHSCNESTRLCSPGGTRARLLRVHRPPARLLEAIVLVEYAPVRYAFNAPDPPASRKLCARSRHANARRFPAPAEPWPASPAGKMALNEGFLQVGLV